MKHYRRFRIILEVIDKMIFAVFVAGALYFFYKLYPLLVELTPNIMEG